MPITEIPAWVIYLIAFAQLALAAAFLIIALSLLPLVKALVTLAQNGSEVAQASKSVVAASEEVVRNSNQTVTAFTRKVEEADPRDMAALAQELGKIERPVPVETSAGIAIEEEGKTI